MKKIIIMMLVCSMLLFGGCGGKKSNETAQNILSEEETGKDETVIYEEKQQENETLSREAGEETGAKTGEAGAAMIETGPDKKIWNDGAINYTLHDFNLYESPQEASLDVSDLVMTDAEYYADRSLFLTVQVDIKNIDAPGDYEDGKINVSRVMIAPKIEGDMEWAGSYPVYLSESGEGADYYHVLVNKGETKTITMGFFVPVNNAEELRSKCQISMYGSYDDGYLYEIPEVKQVG